METKLTSGFLPRSLSTKPKTTALSSKTKKSLSKPSVNTCTVTIHKQNSGDNKNDGDNENGGRDKNDVGSKNNEEDNKNGGGNDAVKEKSEQQRWPDGEEPVCVMCGKYGEYICDETDEDVCSLQCKSLHLADVRKKNGNTTDANSNQSQNTPNYESNQSQGNLNQFNQSEEENADISFDTHFADCLNNVRGKIDTGYNEEHCQFFREKFAIKTKASLFPIPKLILDFSQCGFCEQLQNNLKENNYMSPTAVQMQAVPLGLYGVDMLVAAATSSGKTASFLLPIIHIIQNCLDPLPAIDPVRKHPLALILAPTRELCMQIEEQARSLCHSLDSMKTCLLVGGMPLPQQLYRLRHKIQIVIGTPGRINDVIDNHEGALQLHQIKMVVLDEVDVMLQMGFQNQIERILADVPPARQNMMFSATIPPPIEKLAEKMMNNPVFVSVGSSGLTNESVHQIVMWVEEVSKRKKLFSIICEPKHFRPPVLVFVESKIGADMLCEAVQEKLKITCESIHSDKDQTQRTAILQNFLAGCYKVLIATNIMGRGIDLPNVRQVIVFDMPKTIEEYVHQVGRAGHLQSTGFAMAFINKGNKSIFLSLKGLCEKTGTKLPDELLNSSYLQTSTERRAKMRAAEKEKCLKRKKWDEQELNQKSLLDILMKKRR